MVILDTSGLGNKVKKKSGKKKKDRKEKKTIMINVFVLTITYNLNIKSKISENEPHQLHLSIIFHNIKDCNETVTMTTI